MTTKLYSKKFQNENFWGAAKRRVILYVAAHDRFFHTHFFHLATDCLNRGDEVHLACPAPVDGGRYSTIIREAGVHVHYIPLDRGGMNPFRDLVTLKALYDLYKVIRPDAVHHFAMKPMIYGSLAARLTRVPVAVNSVTGLGYSFTGKSFKARLTGTIIKVLLRIALNFKGCRPVTENPEDGALIARLTPCANVTVIPGAGADTQGLRPVPEPAAPPVRILCVARLLYSKGIGTLIEAVAKLAQDPKMPELRVDIAGGYDAHNPQSIPETQLQEWMRCYPWLRFHGHTDDLLSLYQGCHMAVLATGYGEGLPKALLDAACCARPMIATDIPGCRAVVRHEANGLLVPLIPSRQGADVEALAAAIRRLALDPELRVRYGTQARTDAQTLFSRERISDMYLELYETAHRIPRTDTP